MDEYKALENLLKEIVPDVEGRVFHIVAEYEQMEVLIDGQKPFVTFQFEELKEDITTSGGSGFYRVKIQIDVFGNMDDMKSISKKIREKLTGANTKDEVDFVLVPERGIDIEDGGDLKRHMTMWKGTIGL